MPSTRDDAEPAEIKSPVTFFARSADVGFGVPYRIERTIFDKDAMKNTYCWQVNKNPTKTQFSWKDVRKRKTCRKSGMGFPEQAL